MVGYGRGEGGSGGYEFNIQQMLNILHPGIHEGIINSIQMLNQMHNINYVDDWGNCTLGEEND